MECRSVLPPSQGHVLATKLLPAARQIEQLLAGLGYPSEQSNLQQGFAIDGNT